MTPSPVLSPLSLNSFTREVWSDYDAYVLAQYEAAIAEGCYEPKIYKSPDITQEVLANQGYVAHGLSITPGALIVGFIFPVDIETDGAALFTQVAVQITDVQLDHKFYSQPVPWYLLANGRINQPNLLPVPHPVVAPGRFMVEFWNVSGASFRTQLQIAVLEPKK